MVRPLSIRASGRGNRRFRLQANHCSRHTPCAVTREKRKSYTAPVEKRQLENRFRTSF
jgi:hypothetical protein